MRATLKKITLLLSVVAVCSGQRCLPDADSDGVPDINDNCTNTPLCADVDALGCPSDSDADGVYNGCDDCADTPTGTTVYGYGCPVDVGDGVPIRCIGPDPWTKEIEYSLVNLTGDTTGTILVKGTVQNTGTQDYVSTEGQQAVLLWADDNEVASTAFVNLAVDETVTVELEVAWDTSTEFPPARYYKLIVTYDPDIRDDGVTTNDDCRLTNNTIIRSTDDVATLFD